MTFSSEKEGSGDSRVYHLLKKMSLILASPWSRNSYSKTSMQILVIGEKVLQQEIRNKILKGIDSTIFYQVQ